MGVKPGILTGKEEHRLRVFESTVLMRILGPKKDEVTIGWRKLHNKELHDLHSKPENDQAEEDEMDEACSPNGEQEYI
jgi:hypothetical protein